jgi:hypothetical protein
MLVVAKRKQMLCTICGSEGIFGIACSTVTKIYRKSQCNKCRLRVAIQHAALKKIYTTPPAMCQCCGAVTQLVLDHCHATGNFRGWLCRRCNIGIGGLGDTEFGLQRALDYLRQGIPEVGPPDIQSG